MAVFQWPTRSHQIFNFSPFPWFALNLLCSCNVPGALSSVAFWTLTLTLAWTVKAAFCWGWGAQHMAGLCDKGVEGAMLGLCSPWHAFCSCSAKSLSFITKPKFCWCQGLLVAGTLPFLVACVGCICVGLYFVILSCSVPLSCGVSSASETEKFSAEEQEIWAFPPAREMLWGGCWGAGKALWGAQSRVPGELPCPAHRWEGSSSPAATPLCLQLLFCHSSWEKLIKTSKPRNPGAKLRAGKATFYPVCNTCCSTFPDSLPTLAFHITF